VTPGRTIHRGEGAPVIGSFLLRLVVVYLALTVTVVVLERPIVSATAPLARMGLAIFASELQVNTLTVEHGRLAAAVSVVRANAAGGLGRIRMSVDGNPRTLLIAPILTLSVLLAWRFRSRAQRAWGLLAGALLTSVALMYDLANGVATGVREQIGAPRGMATFLRFVLENGGRQLFGLVAAAVAIWLAGEVARRGVPTSAAEPAPRGRSERRRRKRERALAAR
jgi:hypothetical protein